MGPRPKAALKREAGAGPKAEAGPKEEPQPEAGPEPEEGPEPQSAPETKPVPEPTGATETTGAAELMGAAETLGAAEATPAPPESMGAARDSPAGGEQPAAEAEPQAPVEAAPEADTGASDATVTEGEAGTGAVTEGEAEGTTEEAEESEESEAEETGETGETSGKTTRPAPPDTPDPGLDTAPDTDVGNRPSTPSAPAPRSEVRVVSVRVPVPVPVPQAAPAPRAAPQPHNAEPPVRGPEDDFARTAVPEPLEGGPVEAFDQLYVRQARALTRQAFLLCGHRRVARRAVAWAFHQAWQRWPEVMASSDPAGWVRATAYEYALSPWHQLHPGHRRPEAYPGPPEDKAMLEAFLRLPRLYRAALLLFDGLGLTLPDTAAETEASTRATAARVNHARAALALGWPELRETPDEERAALVGRRLRELAAAQPVRPVPSRLVRRGSEFTTRRWTRASVGLTATVTAATVFTLLTVDSDGASREPAKWPYSRSVFLPETAPAGTGPAVPLPDGSASVSASVRPGGPASAASAPATPRSGRPLPGPAEPATHAYLPQLRSTNERVQLEDFMESDEGREDGSMRAPGRAAQADGPAPQRGTGPSARSARPSLGGPPTLSR
ncbi:MULTISPECIES: hypothetical protein [unclassified Streptomyces]|uniref:hypothetical protein n=1 Tax=unclassified Streptomyces TaxID=2593676 RepID=UPI002DD857B9|nr:MULTISPECIES: hypothetical protein [unclassified Streptomyces]WSA92868.1 hypothetical protein OIE63_15800 [Streptomyces sp. NBC_01795]WSS14498.1 hypothetical protein OG533_23335 [Streptomyces sp. NBC_01186]WSS43315.1 hypothetical protein OG220_24015 [Streptomyces sp. NBC_01187]